MSEKFEAVMCGTWKKLTTGQEGDDSVKHTWVHFCDFFFFFSILPTEKLGQQGTQLQL